MRAYLQQLRQETGTRLLDKVFDPQTDKPSKVLAKEYFIISFYFAHYYDQRLYHHIKWVHNKVCLFLKTALLLTRELEFVGSCQVDILEEIVVPINPYWQISTTFVVGLFFVFLRQQLFKEGNFVHSNFLTCTNIALHKIHYVNTKQLCKKCEWMACWLMHCVFLQIVSWFTFPVSVVAVLCQEKVYGQESVSPRILDASFFLRINYAVIFTISFIMLNICLLSVVCILSWAKGKTRHMYVLKRWCKYDYVFRNQTLKPHLPNIHQWLDQTPA